MAKPEPTVGDILDQLNPTQKEFVHAIVGYVDELKGSLTLEQKIMLQQIISAVLKA